MVFLIFKMKSNIQKNQFKNINQKNYLSIQLIENQQKKSQKHSEYQSQVRDKVIFKEQQSAIILESDIQLEQQYLKAQHKQILEEKYQVDQKLLKQDIQQKQKQLMELENFIIKIHMEIIQINQTCLRLKEFQMKRSSQISQRIKQSQQFNQSSFQGQDYYQSDNKLQIVSNSFYNIKQIGNSNVQADIQKINKQQFSPILEDFNHQQQQQNIINNDIVNVDTLQLQIGIEENIVIQKFKAKKKLKNSKNIKNYNNKFTLNEWYQFFNISQHPLLFFLNFSYIICVSFLSNLFINQ
ncbi:unnamed protein product [Paramecium primaurelia]|uniref:Transmembrane protein n=1 Tax=Paramecium primaurelia TaxID=5886 RepID=A0A8S1JUD0_PARPR|nr:unnamed protein product [Paramecium primaurelia]CAD8044091.1 unnamed protein product [Paramecium primaurelia]